MSKVTPFCCKASSTEEMEQWIILTKPLTLNFPVLSPNSRLLLPTQTPALPLVLPLQVSRMFNRQVKAGT